MKENNIEKLQERLETLHVTQDARLACNADDLDIREEIAEVEEEIKELQDDTNVDRENSIKNERSFIEKDIKDIEKYISFTSKRENFSHDTDWNWNKELANKIEHILSDYKRVLEENEELKEYIAIAPNLDEMTATKYRSIQQDAYIQGRAEEQQKAEQIIYENYIPIQKVKNKIEELENAYWYCENVKNQTIEALEELLEESEKR